MWYVIGAVIVGAALIFLMNETFPTLFANIGETFEGKVSETTEMTDGIRPMQRNLLNNEQIVLNTWVDPDGLVYEYYAGFTTEMVAVKPGSSVIVVPSYSYMAGVNPEGVPYPTVVIGEYDENGVFLTRQSHSENTQQTMTLSSKTHFIIYGGKATGGTYNNGSDGHRMYVVS